MDYNKFNPGETKPSTAHVHVHRIQEIKRAKTVRLNLLEELISRIRSGSYIPAAVAETFSLAIKSSENSIAEAYSCPLPLTVSQDGKGKMDGNLNLESGLSHPRRVAEEKYQNPGGDRAAVPRTTMTKDTPVPPAARDDARFERELDQDVANLFAISRPRKRTSGVFRPIGPCPSGTQPRATISTPSSSSTAGENRGETAVAPPAGGGNKGVLGRMINPKTSIPPVASGKVDELGRMINPKNEGKMYGLDLCSRRDDAGDDLERQNLPQIPPIVTQAQVVEEQSTKVSKSSADEPRVVPADTTTGKGRPVPRNNERNVATTVQGWSNTPDKDLIVHGCHIIGENGKPELAVGSTKLDIVCGNCWKDGGGKRFSFIQDHRVKQIAVAHVNKMHPKCEKLILPTSKAGQFQSHEKPEWGWKQKPKDHNSSLDPGPNNSPDVNEQSDDESPRPAAAAEKLFVDTVPKKPPNAVRVMYFNSQSFSRGKQVMRRRQADLLGVDHCAIVETWAGKDGGNFQSFCDGGAWEVVADRPRAGDNTHGGAAWIQSKGTRFPGVSSDRQLKIDGGEILCVDIATGGGEKIVCPLIYSPPSGGKPLPTGDFPRDDSGGGVIVMGDINARNPLWARGNACDARGEAWGEFLEEFHFPQKKSIHTRPSPRGGTGGSSPDVVAVSLGCCTATVHTLKDSHTDGYLFKESDHRSLLIDFIPSGEIPPSVLTGEKRQSEEGDETPRGHRKKRKLGRVGHGDKHQNKGSSSSSADTVPGDYTSRRAVPIMSKFDKDVYEQATQDFWNNPCRQLLWKGQKLAKGEDPPRGFLDLHEWQQRKLSPSSKDDDDLLKTQSQLLHDCMTTAAQAACPFAKVKKRRYRDALWRSRVQQAALNRRAACAEIPVEVIIEERRKINREVFIATQEKFEDKLKSVKNPGELWEILAELEGREKQDVRTALRKGDDLISDIPKQARLLLEHYTADGRKCSEDSEIVRETNSIRGDINDLADKSAKTAKVTISEVECVIDSLPTSSAPGPDGIRSPFLKHLSSESLEKLREIIDTSISTGQVLSGWKQSVIIPIYKGSGKDRARTDSFRPISLTSLVAKIAEGVVAGRLDALDLAKLWTVKQNGFKKRRSCEDMIGSIVSKIQRNKARGLTTYGGSLDLSRAFELVRHSDALRVFYQWAKEVGGEAPQLVRWISNFLDGRTAVVEWSGFRTAPMECGMCGLPQGTKLGPPIWNTFFSTLLKILGAIKKAEDDRINGDTNEELIAHLVLESDDEAYADDVWLLSTSIAHVQELMNAVGEWCELTGMVLSADKSCIVVFSNDKHNPSPVIKLPSGEDMKVKQQAKCLGVILDQNLSFEAQGLAVVQSCGKRLNALRSAASAWFSPSAGTLRSLYHGLIESKIRFGAGVWLSTLPRTLANELDKIIYQSCCVILGIPRCCHVSHEAAHKEADIKSREELSNLTSALLVSRGWERDPGEPLGYAVSAPGGAHAVPWIRHGMQQLSEIGVTKEQIPREWLAPEVQRSLTAEKCAGKLVIDEAGANDAWVLEQIRGGKRVYAIDGSVKDGVGTFAWAELAELSAGIMPIQRDAGPVGEYSDSYTAEQCAIEKVLTEVATSCSNEGEEEGSDERYLCGVTDDPRRASDTTSTKGVVVVLSDSLSNLNSLDSSRTRDAREERIRKLIEKICHGGIKLVLKYIPSHVGHKANDIPDKLAKAKWKEIFENGADQPESINAGALKTVLTGAIRSRAQKARVTKGKIAGNATLHRLYNRTDMKRNPMLKMKQDLRIPRTIETIYNCARLGLVEIKSNNGGTIKDYSKASEETLDAIEETAKTTKDEDIGNLIPDRLSAHVNTSESNIENLQVLSDNRKRALTFLLRRGRGLTRRCY